MTEGYQALRERAAWVDLAGRGLIRATGEDRARLLHAMSTNHVEQLASGQGCYAFFLTAQGRILADANLLVLPEAILLDTEPETAHSLYQHLDRFIIADDVALEDLSGTWTSLGVEGPQAQSVLAGLGAPEPDAEGSWVDWKGCMVARISATGAPGFRLIAPVSDRERLIASLESHGVPRAGAEAVRIVRLEHGRPRYGEDITNTHLPQETQQLRALHFHKGCYLGQEIVERIRSRGHVNRLLIPLRIAGGRAPTAGSKVMAGEREAGEITSAALSPGLGCVVAIALVRAEHARPQTALTVAGSAAALASAA